MISGEIVDETDQFQDNKTKLVAKRSASSTMLKGYVHEISRYVLDTIKNYWNRIVEHRRPIVDLFNGGTALLDIHTLSDPFDGRTISNTYRDNPV